jgi:hypothetical protein
MIGAVLTLASLARSGIARTPRFACAQKSWLRRGGAVKAFVK